MSPLPGTNPPQVGTTPRALAVVLGEYWVEAGAGLVRWSGGVSGAEVMRRN